jgi:hypothetical protein
MRINGINAMTTSGMSSSSASATSGTSQRTSTLIET